jgi:chromosome transmission fidelity protein 18
MGNSVITKISSALDVKTSFTSDRKPAMIIIDEIDGAAAAGNENNLIKYLVKIATAKTSYNNKRSQNNSKEKTNIKDDDGSETDDENVVFSDYKDKKSRSVSDLGLLHPIICICNDLYVPALRPLRQVAHILQVKPVGPVQLSLRLKSICDREGLKINTRTLVDLAEVMDSDVRSTLNALQFLHRKSLSGNASNFNRDLTFGAFKDTVKPPMKLYESIFLNSTNSNSLKKSNISSGAGRKHSDLLDMVWGSGIGMDKLMGGCFELYPTVKFFDNTAMDRVNAALELFSSFDLMGGNFKNSSGKFDGYLSYKFVGLKDLFSSPVYSPLKYPREDYENFQKISESKAIFKDYLSGLSGKLRSESGIKDSLLLDRIPAILNSSLANFPAIKSSNPKLMKPEEHTLIRKTVELLLSEGVQLRQIKIPDSTAYKFVIDPPIDRLIIHKDEDFYKTLYDYESPQDSHTYSLCRLVAAEMEALRIRRQKSKQSENITEASTTSPSAMTQQPYSIKRKIAEQVLKDPRDLKKRVARDFFGRPIAVDENEESISKNTSGSSTSVNESKMLLWYTQNDGVSNAVRRDIKVGSFCS